MTNNSNLTAALEAHELSCIRDDRILFEGLSFKLDPAQALLIEGRNGSGKTSLLRILCGIRMPDSGSVSWHGGDIYKLATGYHADTTYVGHKDGIKLELTAEENLVFARSLGTPSDISTANALEQMDLGGYDDVQAINLSAGQKRRLALARLLITHSTLWILDEPFTSLDTHGIAMVEAMAADHLGRGGMLALTSHHQVQLHDADIQHLNLST
ncbi:ABC transporter involved in cytochrome c biogenesis, ATPase component CcmA [hydrothermal vent metagenome]|uniref:ABC transporter involved in cytochrome c biogenesis, ATPase component CcmA n=1 Tax=hydrothermal vent metagenome TaxID=652676 RepID=A0A3B0Z0Y8_9ZZZZ